MVFPGHLSHLQEYLIFPFEPFFCEEKTWLDSKLKKIVYNIKILLVNNAILVKKHHFNSREHSPAANLQLLPFPNPGSETHKVENSIVNMRLNTTTLAVLLSCSKAQMDFVKMLGWMEVNIVQNFNEVPELAFLRVIRGFDLHGRAI